MPTKPEANLNLLAALQFRLTEVLAVLRKRREDPRLTLRQSWGQEVIRDRYSFQISKYHELIAVGRTTVDETTWQDLGMDEVFAMVDRTSSFPGRQILYHQMRTYESDGAVLAERTRQHGVFRSDPELREEAQLHLSHLDGPDAAWLSSLLLNNFPEKPKWAWLLHLGGAMPLACFLGMALWPILLIPGAILALLNLVIIETYGRKITPFFEGFSGISRLLWVADGLSALPDSHTMPPIKDLRETAPVRLQLRRRLGWLAMDRENMGDIAQAVIGYINLALLLDIQVYLGSLTLLRRHQTALVKMLEAVGTIDAAISVASFADGLPVVATPSLVDERRIEAAGLYHPRLVAPVGNTIRSDGRSILITGSNMAGKTTFLRTVGINVILAQTLHLCLAEKAAMPRAIVRSSIHREDQLVRGESYYAVEVGRILNMIHDANGGSLHLFLLDEVFRGTNTLERISAATAVLQHLGRAHLAIVTTHDLELQDLLAADYDMHHFSEQIVDGGYSFNYCIQPGPTKGRNAIRLLELSGYPENITRNARQMADQLTSQTGSKFT